MYLVVSGSWWVVHVQVTHQIAYVLLIYLYFNALLGFSLY